MLDMHFDANSNKELFSTAGTFGLLRKELIEHLGIDYAKAFLRRYGWNIGVVHAKEVAQKPLNIREKLDSASGYHLNSGQITDVISDRILEVNPDDTVKYMYAKGIWINSYEVLEHLKHFGPSKNCICHTLAGYASGYTSYLTGMDIHIIEVTCKARGDDDCAFEMRMLEEWDANTQREIANMHETRMIDDLNQSYEALYEEKKHAETIATFHNDLTIGISQGMDVEQLLNTIHENLDIPIIIQDLNFNLLHRAGVSEEQLDIVKEDFLAHVPQTKSGKILLKPIEATPIEIDCAKHKRLLSTITVQRQCVGYVSFLFPKEKTICLEDISFLQRSAVSLALCYLNEKSSLEAIENIRSYFFEQLLQQQFKSKTNMISRGHLLEVDLTSEFYIGHIYYSQKAELADLSAFHTKVMHAFTTYLEMHQIPIFITDFQDQLMFLFPDTENMHGILKNILKHLHRLFKGTSFRIGLSKSLDDIEHISEATRQATAATNVEKKTDIVYFENTSIMGSIINPDNSATIVLLARKELQPIFALKPNKQEEFLKTLYAFLLNNGNLQQTMTDLSLSMSGLVYRIQKLEELLKKDLRDSVHAFELMLLLKSLIILGEIQID